MEPNEQPQPASVKRRDRKRSPGTVREGIIEGLFLACLLEAALIVLLLVLGSLGAPGEVSMIVLIGAIGLGWSQMLVLPIAGAKALARGAHQRAKGIFLTSAILFLITSICGAVL